jgi:hypothetical protein
LTGTDFISIFTPHMRPQTHKTPLTLDPATQGHPLPQALGRFAFGGKKRATARVAPTVRFRDIDVGATLAVAHFTAKFATHTVAHFAPRRPTLPQNFPPPPPPPPPPPQFYTICRNGLQWAYGGEYSTLEGPGYIFHQILTKSTKGGLNG